MAYFSDAAAQTTSGSLTVTVTDANSQAPIDSANVDLYCSGTLRSSAFTDAEGIATFPLSVDAASENPLGRTVRLTSYPNPFDRSARMDLSADEGGLVTVALYDVAGRALLENSAMIVPGAHSIRADLSGLPAGAYFARVTMDGRVIGVAKMLRGSYNPGHPTIVFEPPTAARAFRDDRQGFRSAVSKSDADEAACEVHVSKTGYLGAARQIDTASSETVALSLQTAVVATDVDGHAFFETAVESGGVLYDIATEISVVDEQGSAVEGVHISVSDVGANLGIFITDPLGRYVPQFFVGTPQELADHFGAGKTRAEVMLAVQVTTVLMSEAIIDYGVETARPVVRIGDFYQGATLEPGADYVHMCTTYAEIGQTITDGGFHLADVGMLTISFVGGGVVSEAGIGLVEWATGWSAEEADEALFLEAVVQYGEPAFGEEESAGVRIFAGEVGLDRALGRIQIVKDDTACSTNGGSVSLDPDFTNSIGMDFKRIRPGTFEMGSEHWVAMADERPVHPVTLTRPFYLGQYELTRAQWYTVMRSDPSFHASCGPDCPVEQVSWYDVVAFANALSASEGLAPCYDEDTGAVVDPGAGGDVYQCEGYRLPTEAEWEYAARAGTTTEYSFGEDYPPSSLGEYGWYKDDPDWTTHPIGQKLPNPWGLYDVHGNVWEWVHDWLGPYPEGSVTDPAGPATGSARARRGGSWYMDADRLRSAFRQFNYPPERFNNNLGVRIARSTN